MNLKSTLDVIEDALSNHQVRHALIGGLALAAHGVQRATINVDLLVDGTDKLRVKKIAR